MLGEQVGQPLRGRLVRDTERVAEVLDGELLAPLGRAEVRHGRGAGHEAGGREVGDLDALAQEVGVAAGRGVGEDPVGDRLQRQRPQTVAAGDRRGREVDAAVRQVRDGACRVRQVVDVEQREAEVRRHLRDRAVRQGTRGVAGAPHQVLGGLLDLGQVVVALPHPQPQRRRRAPRLLGGRDRGVVPPGELAVQPDERLEGVGRQVLGGPDGRQPERRVGAGALRLVELDLEGGAAGRRGGVEQVRGRRAQRRRERLQQAQAGFSSAVLDEGELARRAADLPAQLVERQAARGTRVPDAPTEHEQLAARRRGGPGVGGEVDDGTWRLIVMSLTVEQEPAILRSSTSLNHARDAPDPEGGGKSPRPR